MSVGGWGSRATFLLGIFKVLAHFSHADPFAVDLFVVVLWWGQSISALFAYSSSSSSASSFYRNGDL